MNWLTWSVEANECASSSFDIQNSCISLLQMQMVHACLGRRLRKQQTRANFDQDCVWMWLNADLCDFSSTSTVTKKDVKKVGEKHHFCKVWSCQSASLTLRRWWCDMSQIDASFSIWAERVIFQIAEQKDVRLRADARRDKSRPEQNASAKIDQHGSVSTPRFQLFTLFVKN